MVDIRRDDHAAGSDFVTDLLGREVRLPLGNPLHLWRDGSDAGMFELGDWFEACWWLPGFGTFVVALEARPQCPAFRHEVPGRFLGRGRHARSVG